MRDEAHRENRLKCGKTDFRNLIKFFEDADWKGLLDADGYGENMIYL